MNEETAFLEWLLNEHRGVMAVVVLTAYVWMRDAVMGVRHFKNRHNGSRAVTVADLEPIRNQLLQEFGGQDEKGIKHEGALKRRFKLIFHRLNLMAQKQGLATTDKEWNSPPEE